MEHTITKLVSGPSVVNRLELFVIEDETGHMLSVRNDTDYSVFLTRGEAEAASYETTEWRALERVHIVRFARDDCARRTAGAVCVIEAKAAVRERYSDYFAAPRWWMLCLAFVFLAAFTLTAVLF